MLFLPLLLILFFFVHYYKVVHFGISLPADEEEVGEDTANRVPADKRVYYLPDVLVDETSFLTVMTALLIVLTVFFFQAPLEHIANPQSTPLHTVAPWYFYWLQGLLKIADKFIAGVLLPGVLLVLLMAIPYLDYNPSRRGKDRKVAIVAGIVAGAVMIIWSWMGTPEYAVEGAPSVEIVQDVMPEEGSGLSREIGYKHLPLGVWRTDEEYDVHDHEFLELLHEFDNSVDYYRRTDPDFNAPIGILTISQAQPGLKKAELGNHLVRRRRSTAGKYEKNLLAARGLPLLGTVRLEAPLPRSGRRRLEESVRRSCRRVKQRLCIVSTQGPRSPK